MKTLSPMECAVAGIGAWGPGFSDWPSLQALLLDVASGAELAAPASPVCYAEPEPLPPPANPAPAIIPPNERRRAPLPVKLAVEVSWQALQASGMAPEQVACVFGSGLGDTEITDYMCRVLTTEQKQLSPTRFHNSVHNAAAGYWTISVGCMKSANSVAAYRMTAGLTLLEAFTQAVLHQEPVLATLFDDSAHAAYQQIFPCRQAFAMALLLVPVVPVVPVASVVPGVQRVNGSWPRLTLQTPRAGGAECTVVHPGLRDLQRDNPAAGALSLLQLLASTGTPNRDGSNIEAMGAPDKVTLPVSSARAIQFVSSRA